MTIVNRITANLMTRLEGVHNRSGHYQLSKHEDLESLVSRACNVITVGITQKSQLVNLASRVGKIAMKDMELKPDTAKAVMIGAFVIESFDNLGLITVDLTRKASEENASYYVMAGTSPEYAELVSLIEKDGPDFPSLTPYADWESGVHENGASFIKHAGKPVLSQINHEDTPIPLDAVNRLQRGGWVINQEVYKVFKHFYKTGNSPKAFPHQDETKPKVSRSGLATEAAFIIEGAERMGTDTFYHQYNCDFRGRIYPLSAFLNEQSSDRSKGILLFDEPKPLGEDGLYWLLVHTANVWGEDKLALDDRAQFVQDNFEEWEAYAEDPINNTGWMDADKPWSFLAAVMELNKLQYSEGDVSEFPCALPVFVDGSNNGVQHMAALTLDEKTAPLVNLVPQETAGDVYMAVCDSVYEQVEADYNPELDATLEAFLGRLDVLVSDLDTLTSAERNERFSQMSTLREEFELKELAPNYFMKITDRKKRRKMVKRPVMTLGYGGTRGGFASMILEDNKQASQYFRNMQHCWARYFGDLIYFTCRGNETTEARLPSLSKMLDLFEGLAMDASESGSKLTWRTPVTNFPVTQHYMKAKMKRIEFKYKGVRMQLHVQFYEDMSLDKNKQKTSAAPNVIHSFDSAHLQMTVVGHEFRTATIHDSFGCLPSDMAELFVGVRETFVDFYESKPLVSLLEQRDAIERMPEQGSLNLEDVIKSDFSFA